MRESLRVVLNTSPIIVLVRPGLLRKVLDLFNDVEVPNGVLVEVERKKNEVYRELMGVIGEGKIRIGEVVKSFPRLGLGESSAIFLALNEGKIVVLDDKKARKLARDLGLEVIGTLSILKRLYEKGALAEQPSTIYRRLIEIGFYVDKKLFDKIFEEKTKQ